MPVALGGSFLLLGLHLLICQVKPTTWGYFETYVMNVLCNVQGTLQMLFMTVCMPCVTGKSLCSTPTV